MNFKKLHQQLDEFPAHSVTSLRSELWQATEFLNEGMEKEAEEIRAAVKTKLDYLLANSKPYNY